MRVEVRHGCLDVCSDFESSGPNSLLLVDGIG